MKYRKIVFYNLGGKGDVHVSRSFVSFLVQKFKNIECHYTHPYEPLLNIGALTEGNELFYDDLLKKYSPSQKLHRLRLSRGQLTSVGDTLYINTWYNSKPPNEAFIKNKLGKGFINPLPVCSFKALYFNFCAIFDGLGLDITDYEPSLFFPTIPHEASYVADIDRFFKNTPKTSQNVLICNNNALSGQSSNSNLLPAVISLSKNFPSCHFFITNGFVESASNIYSLEGAAYDGCNKIAYIASKCKLIVGRASGPHTFCINKDLYSDPTKTIVFESNSDPEAFLKWHEFGINARCKIHQIDGERLKARLNDILRNS